MMAPDDDDADDVISWHRHTYSSYLGDLLDVPDGHGSLG